MKNTYDRARYLRLLSSNTPESGRQKLLDRDLIEDMQKKQLTSTPLQKQLSKKGFEKGVYFRKEVVDFGIASTGSILRMKIELCNSTDDEVSHENS